jgi:7-cyano-7-deazaguanine synthase
MKRKAVILHSGGLDSTLCVLLAQRKGLDILSLGIDYGQRHRIELDYAKLQCERLGVPRRIIRLEWDKPKRDLPIERDVDEMRRSISPAFLPGRNVVFLAIACAEAAGIGADEVWIGINAIDFSGYPDCQPNFIRAFRNMQDHAAPHGPLIRAPLLNRTKPQIARLGYKYGLRRGDVWCCYRPAVTPNGVEPCHKCDACILHEFAWSEGLKRAAAQTEESRK